MKKPRPNKQKEVTAQSFRRLARKARSYRNLQRYSARQADRRLKAARRRLDRHALSDALVDRAAALGAAEAYDGFAAICDAEAHTLRGMR